MKTIVFACRKGGVSKTTTAHAVGARMAQLGKRVLYCDMDPQASLSGIFRAKKDQPGIYSVIQNKMSCEDAIVSTDLGDILPACESMAGADTALAEVGREYRLRESLQRVADRYDYCIIDTGPALDVLTVNALAAADLLVVPANADPLGIDGVTMLLKTAITVKKYCNPALTFGGIVVTRYSPRMVLNRDVVTTLAKLAEKFGGKVYISAIREAVAVREAQASHKSLFDYAPTATASLDYATLTDEIMAEMETEDEADG